MKEIVSYEFMRSAPVELVLRAYDKAVAKVSEEDRAKLLVHTDQGFQFTSFAYFSRVAERGVTEPMSRRGNCLDNAPIESFSGYLKDHLDLTTITNFDELKKHVTAEIEYYKRERPQLGLDVKSEMSWSWTKRSSAIGLRRIRQIF